MSQSVKSATKQYVYGIRYFQEFLRIYYPDSFLPLSGQQWGYYVAFLHQKKLAASTIKGYCNHVRYFCECRGFPRPDLKLLPTIGRLWKVLSKITGTVKPLKLPITWNLGTRIVDIFPAEWADSFVFGTLLLVGIAGLFRLGELTVKSRSSFVEAKVLKVAHVTFFDDCVRIWLPFSKVDPYGNGYPVYIPRHKNPKYCPVERLKCLVKGKAPTDYLFTWPTGVLISRRAFLTMLNKGLRMLHIDPKQYAGHSLRRGGAFTALRNGVPHPLIQVLGRWSSAAFLRYLQFVPPQVQQLNQLLGYTRSAMI